MKILTNKKYKRLLNLAYPDSPFETSYKNQCEILEDKNKKLNIELENAKNLKAILEKLYPLNQFMSSLIGTNGCVLSNVSGSGYQLNLPDTVLQYTDDILGGKVIKQEGIKCLVVDKDGNVKTGLTKEKADKGYKYKLVRE